MNNSAAIVGEIFREAGTAFTKLSEMTLMLQPMDDAPPGSKWSEEEVEMLRGCVNRFAVELNKISQHIKTRTMRHLRNLLDMETATINVPSRNNEDLFHFNPSIIPQTPPEILMEEDTIPQQAPSSVDIGTLNPLSTTTNNDSETQILHTEPTFQTKFQKVSYLIRPQRNTDPVPGAFASFLGHILQPQTLNPFGPFSSLTSTHCMHCLQCLQHDRFKSTPGCVQAPYSNPRYFGSIQAEKDQAVRVPSSAHSARGTGSRDRGDRGRYATQTATAVAVDFASVALPTAEAHQGQIETRSRRKRNVRNCDKIEQNVSKKRKKATTATTPSSKKRTKKNK